MTSLPCASQSDATLVRQYVTSYTNHPNQLYYKGKQVVSTFAGTACTFGFSDWNAGFNYAVKTGVSASVAFIPAIFSDPSTWSSQSVMDGELNWNGGWPLVSCENISIIHHNLIRMNSSDG